MKWGQASLGRTRVASKIPHRGTIRPSKFDLRCMPTHIIVCSGEQSIGMKNAITRRDFLSGAAAVALATGARTSAHSAALPSVSDPLAEFDYGAVELTG